jgi:chemotaxis methyl-accepting protein methylase
MILSPPDNSVPKAREFAFSDDDFNALRALVKAHTGINLGAQKRELVYGRISQRLRGPFRKPVQGVHRLLAHRQDDLPAGVP